MHWHAAVLRKFLILTTFISFFCVVAFAQQTATPTITALFKFTCNGNLCSNGSFPKGKLVQAQDGNFKMRLRALTQDREPSHCCAGLADRVQAVSSSRRRTT